MCVSPNGGGVRDDERTRLTAKLIVLVALETLRDDRQSRRSRSPAQSAFNPDEQYDAPRIGAKSINARSDDDLREPRAMLIRASPASA